MLRSLPLLGVSLIVYVALLYVTGSAEPPWYERPAATIMLPSDGSWTIAAGELFQLSTLVLLFIEVVRSTRADGLPLINHSLDVIVFVAALTLFLTIPSFGNSTFFSLLVMSLFDFVAGFIITTASARRDVMFRSGPRHEQVSHD